MSYSRDTDTTIMMDVWGNTYKQLSSVVEKKKWQHFNKRLVWAWVHRKKYLIPLQMENATIFTTYLCNFISLSNFDDQILYG